MTFINWIGIAMTAAILVTGMILRRFWRKKVDNLDGFCGIVRKRETVQERRTNNG